MANPQVVEIDPQAAEAKPQGPGKGLIFGLIAGAVAIGLALGAVAIAPQFAGKSGDAAAKADEAAGEGHGAEALMSGEGGGHSGGSALELQNIVVNPTGSEGVHFLMASVVIDISDKELLDFLRSNEYIVQDVVLETLGSRTLEWLSRPNARKEMKELLAQDVGELVGSADIVTVYLPGFVVQ